MPDDARPPGDTQHQRLAARVALYADLLAQDRGVLIARGTPEHEVDDLIQETCRRLLDGSRAEPDPGRGNERTHLIQTVKSMLDARLRKSEREPDHVSFEHLLEDCADPITPERRVLEEEERVVLERAATEIAATHPQYQRIVRSMRRLHDRGEDPTVRAIAREACVKEPIVRAFARAVARRAELEGHPVLGAGTVVPPTNVPKEARP